MDKKIKQHLSVSNYMRHRKNLTIAKLSQKIGIPGMSISRIENRNWAVDVHPVLVLARYFGVSVDAILQNDFKAVFSTQEENTAPTHKLYDHYAKINTIRHENGLTGEDWVYQQECKRLENTVMKYAVNANYADDTDAHFDILSFSDTGQPIVIEVKTTNKGPYDYFSMTAAELETARECLDEGICYEVHRVYHIKDSRKVNRLIISAEELFRDYDIIPQHYRVKRKVV